MNSLAARCSGLVLAPSIWAVNVQLGQILPYADCSGGTAWTLVATCAAIILATAGASISFRHHALTVSRMALFISRLSAFIGFAFVFALLLQGAAVLLLSTCAR